MAKFSVLFPHGGGKKWVEPGEQPLPGRFIRAPKPGKRECVSAQQIQLIILGKFGPINSFQSRENSVLQFRRRLRIGRYAVKLVPAADSAESCQSRNRGARIF